MGKAVGLGALAYLAASLPHQQPGPLIHIVQELARQSEIAQVSWILQQEQQVAARQVGCLAAIRLPPVGLVGQPLQDRAQL